MSHRALVAFVVLSWTGASLSALTVRGSFAVIEPPDVVVGGDDCFWTTYHDCAGAPESCNGADPPCDAAHKCNMGGEWGAEEETSLNEWRTCDPSESGYFDCTDAAWLPCRQEYKCHTDCEQNMQGDWVCKAPTATRGADYHWENYATRGEPGECMDDDT